ncbi:hypothetical protein [Microbacterium sp. ANT_H45B]|uniref:hypothetical protein n=1 Tax=Microbacterium sp. ANT_H45B TaxID=2597346 RepID=UPI003977AB8B
MIDAGVPTIVVAAALRHSDTQSVEKYVRVKEAAISAAIRGLPSVRVPLASARGQRRP